MSRQSILDAFNKFDLNKDGVISKGEFLTVMTRPNQYATPLSVADAAMLFDEADRNGDGVVTLQEFASSWLAPQPPQPMVRSTVTAQDRAMRDRNEGEIVAVQDALEHEIFPQYHNLKQAFRAMDADGNGYLSHEEFSNALKHFAPEIGVQLNDHQVSLLIGEYDVDRNGQIDYNEFKRCLGHQVPYVSRGPPPPLDAPLAVPPPASSSAGGGGGAGAGATAAAAAAAGGGGAATPAAPRVSSKEVAAIEEALRTKLDEKYRTLREAFKASDADSSGYIDAKEFAAIFKRHHIPVSDSHMQLLVQRFDKDGNNKVDFNEFAKWMAPGYHSHR